MDKEYYDSLIKTKKIIVGVTCTHCGEEFMMFEVFSSAGENAVCKRCAMNGAKEEGVTLLEYLSKHVWHTELT